MKEKLLAIKKSRVDRISIHPQTMNDRILGTIGRSHSYNVLRAYHTAREWV
jgi:oxygen-independent coproporphyrinogen-3 oxidase